MGLSPLGGLLAHHVRVKGLLLGCQLLCVRLSLIQLLLLHASLQLVLVLQSLPLHLLLTRYTFFVCLATFLTHRLFLLELLSVALQLKLDLVLSLLLLHLLLKLNRLALLLLLHLSLLDLQFPVQSKVKLVSFFIVVSP